MTSFLTGGLGSLNSNPVSRESRALEASKTAGKSFVNKDFVKNIAFLNQTSDTHGAWLQKLQSGVDQANQNVLEQVQGFWGDMFTLFAGFEPTGIDVGDVKYIIQGLGAFLGINPDTPFPLNLLEAALHFFNTYIIPLDQFTDVIFDAILAWAEEFGLSEEFIESIEGLMEAVSMLGETFFDLFDSLGELLSAFGFLSWTSTSGIGDLWDTLVNLIDGLALEPLKPVLSLLADLGIPFINALTGIVNGVVGILVPITHIISGAPNSLVAPGFTDSDSFVAANGWTRDAFVGRTFEGSAKATANSTVRELISLPIAASEGLKVDQAVWLSWASASYTGSNHASLNIRTYNGENLVQNIVMQAITFTGANQPTWQQLSGSYTIPAGVTHYRTSLRVNANVMTGNVWFDDAESKVTGGFLTDLFGGILDMFGLGFLEDLISLNPFDIWTTIINGFLNPLQLIEDFFARDFVQDLLDTIISVIRGIPFVGGFLADLLEDLTDWFDDTQATAAQAGDALLIATTIEPVVEQTAETVETGFAGMIDAWTEDTSGTGVATDAIETITNIRIAIADGYTMVVFTASDPAWPVPPGLAAAQYAWGGAINGGGKGVNGGSLSNNQFAYAYGGEPGIDGGFAMNPIDIPSLGSTLNIAVGAASTTQGVNGGTSSIAGIVTGISGTSSIPKLEAFFGATSKPGSGGRGGDAIAVGGVGPVQAGQAGQSSATATGGSSGGITSGAAGGNGVAGQTGSMPISGGSGGAGGSGGSGFSAVGGTGGNGGFPGGASGGGGGAASHAGGVTPGVSGTPAHGLCFVIYK